MIQPKIIQTKISLIKQTPIQTITHHQTLQKIIILHIIIPLTQIQVIIILQKITPSIILHQIKILTLILPLQKTLQILLHQIPTQIIKTN